MTVATGPLNAAAAIKRAVEMHLEGYASITVTNVETGEQFKVERYMVDSSRTVH